MINEKLKNLKMVKYGGHEPTIDELTEESKDTSIDMRMERMGENPNFQFSNIEFPRFRFRRKFRPKSLDPLLPIPGIYSPSSNTPKMANHTGLTIDVNRTKNSFRLFNNQLYGGNEDT